MGNPIKCHVIFLEDIADGLEKVKISFVNDLNSHQLTKNLMYITRNVLTSDSLAEDFESIPRPCKCKVCSDDCSCALGSKIPYKGQKLADDFVSNLSRPILECSELCGCEKICPNRVVQYGIKFKLQIFLTENKGFGVRTLEFIPKFSFVCEYAGELIDKAEAKKRTENRPASDPNYIFVLNEHTLGQSNICTIIDPTYKGNVGRYLNHSCSPNLFPLPVRVDSMLPRVCFFTKRNIEPLEELTYHYGVLDDQEVEKDIHQLNIDKKFKMCYCNSSACSGTLPFDAKAFIE